MKQVTFPPITISTVDYDRLSWIATAGVNGQRYTVAEMLADELDRAMIAAPGAIRPDIVTMHSEVEYQDEVTGDVRRATLVYPGEKDLDAGRIPHRLHRDAGRLTPGWELVLSKRSMALGYLGMAAGLVVAEYVLPTRKARN